jgi:hypothetical protein
VKTGMRILQGAVTLSATDLANLSLDKNASEPRVRLFQCLQRIDSEIWGSKIWPCNIVYVPQARSIL